jgi:hypothetical protein
MRDNPSADNLLFVFFSIGIVVFGIGVYRVFFSENEKATIENTPVVFQCPEEAKAWTALRAGRFSEEAADEGLIELRKRGGVCPKK